MGIIREPDIGDHDARGQGAESRFAADDEAEAGGPFHLGGDVAVDGLPRQAPWNERSREREDNNAGERDESSAVTKHESSIGPPSQRRAAYRR